MFRDDKLTLKRLIETKTDGEWASQEQTIYSNIPCHLSIRSKDDILQGESIGTLLLDFQLFIDNNSNCNLQLNDIAEIKTSMGDEYRLYVGEGFKYPITSQYQLKRDKIV